MNPADAIVKHFLTLRVDRFLELGHCGAGEVQARGYRTFPVRRREAPEGQLITPGRLSLSG
jgi:hypothetical protein